MTRRRIVTVPSVLIASIVWAGCSPDESGSRDQPTKTEVETPADSPGTPETAPRAASLESVSKCGISDYEQVDGALRTISSKAVERCKASGSLPTEGVFDGDSSKLRWSATKSGETITYEMASTSDPQTVGLQLTCDGADCTCGPFVSKSLASEYEALEAAHQSLTLHRLAGSFVGGSPDGGQRLLDQHATDSPDGELASVREAYRQRLTKLKKEPGKAETSGTKPTPSGNELKCEVDDREGIEAALREMSTKAIEECKTAGTMPIEGVFVGDEKKYRWTAQSSQARAIYEVQKLDAPSMSGLRQTCYAEGCECEPPLPKSLGSEFSILEGALKQLLIKEGGNDPVPVDPGRLQNAQRSLDRHARDFPEGALSALRERYRRRLAEARKEDRG